MPESFTCKLKQLLPVGFPWLPADAHAEDLGELRFSVDFSIEECVLSDTIAKNPDFLTEYLHLLAENGNTRPLHERLCALFGLNAHSLNMAITAEMLWESVADWLVEIMAKILPVECDPQAVGDVVQFGELGFISLKRIVLLLRFRPFQ